MDEVRGLFALCAGIHGKIKRPWLMGGNHLKSEKEKLLKSAVLDWAKAIIIAVVLALLIPNFLFAPYLVDGESMDPTLHDRERIFVNMTVKYISDFKRGKIVVLNGKRALCQTDYRTSRRHGANEKRSAVHQRQKCPNRI